MPAEQARRWLADQQPDDAAALQASEDHQGQPAPQEGPEEGAPLWVWPENHAVHRLFMGLQTQWHTNPLSGELQGLRYDAADVVLRRLALKKPGEVFEHLQEMERAALVALRNTEEGSTHEH